MTKTIFILTQEYANLIHTNNGTIHPDLQKTLDERGIKRTTENGKKGETREITYKKGLLSSIIHPSAYDNTIIIEIRGPSTIITEKITSREYGQLNTLYKGYYFFGNIPN